MDAITAVAMLSRVAFPAWNHEFLSTCSDMQKKKLVTGVATYPVWVGARYTKILVCNIWVYEEVSEVEILVCDIWVYREDHEAEIMVRDIWVYEELSELLGRDIWVYE